MSGGGGGGQAVAGKTKQKQKEVSKSETQTAQSGETTSTVTPTLDAEIASGIKGEFGDYLKTTGDFGQDIEDWQAAGFSPDQLAGFESMRQAAGAEGPQQSAIDQLRRTAEGDYLYGGEGFNAAVDAAYRAGMPRVLSAFGGSGRDDGGLARVALAQQFADPFAAQYGQERQLQQAAQGLLPQLSLAPGQTLQDIGKQYQELEQYGRNFPLSLYPQLAQLQQGAVNFAQPFLGQTTNTRTSGTSQQMVDAMGRMNQIGTEMPAYFPGSSSAGILGGIASGAGAGGMIGGPWGAAAGAVGGGLLSAFG